MLVFLSFHFVTVVTAVIMQLLCQQCGVHCIKFHILWNLGG